MIAKPDHTPTPGNRRVRASAAVVVALCLALSGCKSLSEKKPVCDAPALSADYFSDDQKPTTLEAQEDNLEIQPAGFPLLPPVSVQPFPEPVAYDPNQPQPEPHSDPVLNPEFEAQPNVVPATSPPHITGTHLGSMQIPASEIALQFQQENERLKHSQSTLLADNQQTRTELSRTQDLLNRANTAMTNAQLTLEQAERANQELKGQIADVQRRQQRDQLNADRMLQSIRDELDDVLMREIASQQR